VGNATKTEVEHEVVGIEIRAEEQTAPAKEVAAADPLTKPDMVNEVEETVDDFLNAPREIIIFFLSFCITLGASFYTLLFYNINESHNISHLQLSSAQSIY
ncbi:hypothetical protein U1Q18_047291, partial [Sarracenia purpurea var. burkii]